MIKKLETERLILRRFKNTDLEDFFAYAKNPNVGPNAGWRPHETKEETAIILDDFIGGDEVWAIVLKENNKLVGSIGLHKDELRTARNVKMLGFVLSEEYWGQGIMTEAVKEVVRYGFEELNLDLLSVAHFPFNIGSKRVIEKSGFSYEGTLRLAKLIYDGSIYDSLCYSLTKVEWESRR